MPAPKLLRDMAPNEARDKVSKNQHANARINKLFYDGDHWQGGDAWVGPRPGASETGAAAVILEIARGFVSRNAVSEVTNRHANALVGREPKWGFALQRDLGEEDEPETEEQALIDEAEALVTKWWNDRGVAALLQQLVATCAHQERATLRLFIPQGRLTQAKRAPTVEEASKGLEEVVYMQATAPNMERALDMIYLDAPSPVDAVVLEDPYTMEPVSVHVVTVDEQQYVDITFVRRDPSTLELSETVYRRTGADSTVDHSYPLGGRLLMAQLKRSLLINAQVLQQQKSLNLALSMIPRNVVTGGFLERIILNAQMPGYWIDDDTVELGKRFVPGTYRTGPGTTNWLEGVETEDLEGNQKKATPGVVFREPVKPDASIAAAGAHYEAILHEVDQAHHLIAGDAVASAISRVEARMDFLHSLRLTQSPLEAVGRWLLETVLALAEAVCGDTRFTKALRADFSCRLQVGQLTSDEQVAIVQLVEAGLIAREDAMALLGVDDVDIAIAKINSQPGSLLKMRTLQAEALLAWQSANVPLEVALTLVGLSDEEIKKILEAEPVPDPNDPAAKDPEAPPVPEEEPVPAGAR